MAAKKAKKPNPYSRSQMRSRFRKPRQRRSGAVLWGAVIGVIVILGVVGVALVRSDHQASANIAPRPPAGETFGGDHWHSYLGINLCGTWQPNWPSFDTRADSANVQTGLHSHGDGLIHIHPFSRSEGGNNATLGRFFDNGGGSISSSSVTVATGMEMSSGDVCDSGPYEGQEVVLRWTVDGEEREGNPGDLKLENGEIIAIYLLPEDAPLEAPPGAEASLGAPSDVPIQPPTGLEGVEGLEGLEGVEGVEGLEGVEGEVPADTGAGADQTGGEAPPP